MPGLRVGEHPPPHARTADKFAVVRGIKSVDPGDHAPYHTLPGFPGRGRRPTHVLDDRERGPS